MKKVLIVVSTWKPCMMADMQRARLVAGELPAFGWEAEILAPGKTFQTDFSRVQGEGMEFPSLPIHEVGLWRPELFKLIGSRNVGIRARIPLGKAGLELLRQKHFDLVYFSTTQHWLTCNGAAWRRWSGVPYIADLHDPVYQEKRTYFVSRHRVKERVARLLGRVIEQRALGKADGVVSVSPGYVKDVGRRNPSAVWLRSGHTLVQPFPADLTELERGQSLQPTYPITYVGAGGNIMRKGWEELLRCLSVWQRTSGGQLPRIILKGTDTCWQLGASPYLQGISDECGFAGLISEDPQRISYRESIELMRGSRGLLVLGVDDPNYRPSKLHTCLAAGLPLLVILRGASALREELSAAGPGIHQIVFGDRFTEPEANERALTSFLEEVNVAARWSRESRKFLTAAASAADHASLFAKCVRGARATQ